MLVNVEIMAFISKWFAANSLLFNANKTNSSMCFIEVSNS